MHEGDYKEPKGHPNERRQPRPLQGKRITNQLPCQPHPAKPKPKIQYPSKEHPQTDTFRDILTKRDRHKESQSKLQHRPLKRPPQQSNADKLQNKKEGSKSRSRSKGIGKSKSMKQLVKKSKSMVRLEPHRNQQKQQRKSESPHNHAKSMIAYPERKPYKSNFNSKTTRQIVSELTTEREKSKSKLKVTKAFKKVKNQIIKKPAPKSVKVKSQKQNSKTQKRPKLMKVKKEKKVLISEQNSKIRRDAEQWQMSLNEDQFLDPKGQNHKQKNNRPKDSNIVEIPKRKERLSLNTNNPRKPSLKNKTQVEIQSYRSRKKQIEYYAAVKIQKVFRGYLTRKYIKQCFQHNAAINIQRLWRGYRARKMFRKMVQLVNPHSVQISPNKEAPAPKISKILQQQQYLLQKSSQRSDLKSSGLNQRWASILQQILSEESVNNNIKRKIQNFLQSQRKQLTEFQIQQSRSPSARSSISSQIITNQINSQRHFLAQQRLRRQKPNDPFTIQSPNQYFSPRRLQYGSPQNQLGSPQSALQMQSPPRSSAELLVANLKNIQKLHGDRLKIKANSEKEQLNHMLIKNKLSPRTHQKKYKEVELILENQLEKFNQSINEVVKNCIIYGQTDEIPENPMITPKKDLIELQLPQQRSPRPHHPSQPQEMSLQFRQYYQNKNQPPLQPQAAQPFDTSYPFIEQYLINLIDFVRQSDGGRYVQKVLSTLFKPKNHQIDTILRNLKVVTEGSEQDQNQNSFRLPMYKYIDLQEEIIEKQLSDQFNFTFPKLRQNQLGTHNPLQQHFLKMIVDCMNQALNALRPQSYPFAQTKLNNINTLKGLQKISLFQYEGPEEEMHYQFICAQALNKIFYWNRLQWGKIIRYSDDTENVTETRAYLIKQQEASILQVQANEQWIFYDELVEILGNITDQVFETMIFEEIAAVWGAIMEWLEKMGRSPMKIEPPNNRAFYEP